MAVVISVMLSLASGRCDIIYLPENPHDSEELRDSPDLRELPHVRRVDEGDADEVRQDGQQVNDVHRALHELELARRGDQSYLRSYTSLFFYRGVPALPSMSRHPYDTHDYLALA